MRTGPDRAERGRGSTRLAPGPAPGPPTSGVLTTRAAVLGLVLCALVVSAALPLREFLAQRGRIERLEQQQQAQRERVAVLEHQRRLLDDPAYTARLARERLHYVQPGETAYVVLGPETADRAVPGRSGTEAADAAPWYTRLLGSVQDADAYQPTDR